MHDFKYVGGQLFCESVSVEGLARKFGTPLYVYSQKTLTDHFHKLDRAMAGVPHRICFAVKSNGNVSILRVLANLGGGFDIVSAGELGRVLAAGGNPANCVFAGAGKTEAEIEFALEQGVYSFNVESVPELDRIHRIAGRRKKIAPVAMRINPDVEAFTHSKITTGTHENKFGIPLEDVEAVYARAAKMKNLRLRGVQMHIGSQLTRVSPFEKAVRKVLPMVRRLAETYELEFFSIGGGLGIVYQPALASGQEEWWRLPGARDILTPQKYAASLLPLLQPLGLNILLEPGRFISGNAGVLIARVEYVKKTARKTFVIVDAAMNDLIRPAFYDAYHEIVPVRRRTGATLKADVVGGICESGDYFCKDRRIAQIREGDCLALLSAGAYGFVMASNYNARPLPAEVLVNGRKFALARRRQVVEEIWSGETIVPWLK